MKTALTILAIVVLVAAGATSYAQTGPDERVKILPTISRGVIKLHYALPVESPLEVRFRNAAGDVIGRDRISEKSETGISKRYNVSKINSKDFWIEITSRDHVLVYRVSPSDDRKTFTAALEPTSHQFLVKANN